MKLYLIGSLRNAEIPRIGNALRSEGWEVFDDWFAAGPEADDKWREYELLRGRSYLDALSGAAAKNVFSFDKRHLDASDAAILALPAGKSGHLELGYMLGRGRRGYVLLDNPERWDVMYQFATLVTDKLEDIVKDLKVDRDIIGTCKLCQTVIKHSAYTSFEGGLVHYDCYRQHTQGPEQISSSPDPTGFSLRGETNEVGQSVCGGNGRESYALHSEIQGLLKDSPGSSLSGKARAKR